MLTYLHHILGITGFLASLLTKHDFFLVGAVGTQIVEISTPFMHYRQFLFIHKKDDSIIQTINSGLFFLTFLISRIFYQFYLIVLSFEWYNVRNLENVRFIILMFNRTSLSMPLLRSTK